MFYIFQNTNVMNSFMTNLYKQTSTPGSSSHSPAGGAVDRTKSALNRVKDDGRGFKSCPPSPKKSEVKRTGSQSQPGSPRSQGADPDEEIFMIDRVGDAKMRIDPYRKDSASPKPKLKTSSHAASPRTKLKPSVASVQTAEPKKIAESLKSRAESVQTAEPINIADSLRVRAANVQTAEPNNIVDSLKAGVPSTPTVEPKKVADSSENSTLESNDAKDLLKTPNNRQAATQPADVRIIV